MSIKAVSVWGQTEEKNWITVERYSTDTRGLELLASVAAIHGLFADTEKEEDLEGIKMKQLQDWLVVEDSNACGGVEEDITDIKQLQKWHKSYTNLEDEEEDNTSEDDEDTSVGDKENIYAKIENMFTDEWPSEDEEDTSDTSEGIQNIFTSKWVDENIDEDENMDEDENSTTDEKDSTTDEDITADENSTTDEDITADEDSTSEEDSTDEDITADEDSTSEEDSTDEDMDIFTEEDETTTDGDEIED